MASLSNQYKSITNKSSELYISKLKEGSYIIELIDVVLVASLPIMSNVSTVVQFIEYLKSAKDWLLGKIEKPKNIQFTKEDLIDLKDLLNPPLVVNNYATMNFYYDQTESVKFEKDDIKQISDNI